MLISLAFVYEYYTLDLNFAVLDKQHKFHNSIESLYNRRALINSIRSKVRRKS